MTASTAGLAPRTRGWRSLHPAVRLAVVVLALLVVVNIALQLLDSTTRGADETAPDSSSFSTGSTGVAAWAELLRRNGRATDELRGSLADESLSPDATLVVLEPDHIDDDEARGVRTFVERGGRLVTAGVSAGSLLRELFEEAPTWSGIGVRRARPEAPAPEVAGIEEIVAAGKGTWSNVGDTEAILGGEQGVLATVADVGDGSVVMLADASPLQNRLLDQADNAAFALQITRDSGRVEFAEGEHGYGDASGLAAIPSRWKWAIAGLAVAGLVGAIAVGRRLGPPEDSARDLPPPRRAYVDAVAEALARTRRPAAALAPLQDAVRARLARRAGLGPDAAEPELRAAATRLGWEAPEIDAVFGPVAGDDGALAVGRALARITGGDEQ